MIETATRRRWLHFRLSTLMLLMVIIALGVGQFQATREVLEMRQADKRLRDENAQLRAEVGYLVVEDLQKVSVLGLSTLDPMTWRWKVYLPKGDWKLCSATQGIPEVGFVSPSFIQGGVLAENQLSIEASVRKGADGQWNFVMRHSNSTSSQGLAGHTMATGNISSTSSSAGNGRQETLDPDQPVTLLRLRCMKMVPDAGGGKSQQPTGPCDGLLFWIERNIAAAAAPIRPAAAAAQPAAR